MKKFSLLAAFSLFTTVLSANPPHIGYPNNLPKLSEIKKEAPRDIETKADHYFNAKDYERAYYYYLALSQIKKRLNAAQEYRLGKTPFMLRTEINYRPHPVGLDANIFNGKSFGGKPTGVYTSKTLNFGFDIPITLNYNLIQKENFAFLKLKRLEMGVFAGVTIQLQARGERETYAIGKNFNSPGMGTPPAMKRNATFYF